MGPIIATFALLSILAMEVISPVLHCDTKTVIREDGSKAAEITRCK